MVFWMPSITDKKFPRSPVKAFLFFIAFLLLTVLGFVLIWPTLRPLPFDPDEAYRLALRYHQSGRWEDLDSQLRLLAISNENTRFNETVWVRWLNLGRRLGLATQRWEPLLLLARKARAELPGNPTLKMFQMYARIKNKDFSEVPTPQEISEAQNPIYRRIVLDYYSWLYFQKTKQSGLFDPREFLTSQDLEFWSLLADAFPNEPLFNARALLLSLQENRPELFLRYLTSMELSNRQRSVFRNWDPALIDKLVGLASFRLGRWETALTFLRRSMDVGSSEPSTSYVVAESAYRLGKLRYADQVLQEKLRQNQDLAPIRQRLLQNLAYLALAQANIEGVRRLLDSQEIDKDLQLYLRGILASNPADRRNLQRQFLDYLNSLADPGVSTVFFYYASFPDILTPTLLNSALEKYKASEIDDVPYLQALVEMLLWQLNREGKFSLTMETAEKWSRTWPNTWFLQKETALALAQLPSRASEAYQLWNKASVLDRNLFWEYNASRLAAILVRVQDNRRPYDQSLAHNHRAEFLASQLPETLAQRRFLARLFFDRSVWLYYSGQEVESRKSLVIARRLDPGFLTAQTYLNTTLLKEIDGENQE